MSREAANDQMSSGRTSKSAHSRDTVDWDYYRKAHRAFAESPLVPPEAVAMFTYCLSLQGKKSHAFPSMRGLMKRFGSQDKVQRWVRITQKALPEVFRVEPGIGKRRHSYHCTDFNKWPMALIERLDAGKPKKRRKPTIVDLHHEKIRQIAAAPKTGTQETAPVYQEPVHYMGSMEVISTTASNTEPITNPNEVEKHICAACHTFAPNGFQYHAVWVCSSDCERDYYEAHIQLPF